MAAFELGGCLVSCRVAAACTLPCEQGRQPEIKITNDPPDWSSLKIGEYGKENVFPSKIYQLQPMMGSAARRLRQAGYTPAGHQHVVSGTEILICSSDSGGHLLGSFAIITPYISTPKKRLGRLGGEPLTSDTHTECV
ncbi:hypothetical protein MGYG_03192 [Nannizzia gypsea CBS 118893]|uniref:Uncharacterized protein n=1 Tax=Arthroderma gypseum (strain ATCC MYA-4604 / CBS 118893) TaxID=535722 RepID=E4URC4_ARTGP|nr:hypothetical protein MGYG_03192 [Nannizzia gypsea CBS 118893]EFR00187.1 hypothetical protein MGYG_03192 [Nannizzia gypsea CBS 118893]